MADDCDPPRDLLGDPWTDQRDPRGRKRHKRSAYVAEKVALLKAAGFPVALIAQRVFLSEPTLRRYYFRELGEASRLTKAVVLESAFAKAKGGSASHQKLILEQLEKGEATRFDERQARSSPSTPIGKKQAADQAAQTAGDGSDWGDDLKFTVPN